MNRELERLVKEKHDELLGITYASAFNEGAIASPLYTKFEESIFTVAMLQERLANIRDKMDIESTKVEHEILNTMRFIKEKIAESSNENKYSKLFIPDLSDQSSGGTTIKNGTIYGYGILSSSSNRLTLTEEEVASYFHTVDGPIKSKVVKQKTSDQYMYENFHIVPVTSYSKDAFLTINLNLDRVEAIHSIEIDMKKNRAIKLFYKEPGKRDYIFLKEISGSKINENLSKNITDLKIVIKITSMDRETGGVFFNRFSINRFMLSSNASLDISTTVNTNAKKIDVIRCDSSNDNINYLVSVNGRAFKNATKGPITAYGVEDGSIYTLNAIRARREDCKELRVFQIQSEASTIASNKWVAFAGKGEFSEVDYGSIQFYKTVAVYRDIFDLTISDSKYIYMNGEKKEGTFTIYPGVYEILIPKAQFTQTHSLKFYGKIEYDGETVKLTRQDGVVEEILSQNDIHAVIETTASMIFSERLEIQAVDELGFFSVETLQNTVYLGFEPLSPYIEEVKIRIEFTESQKIAEIYHIAVKVY